MANHSKAENSADDKSYVGYLAPQTEQGKVSLLRLPYNLQY